MKAQDLMVGDWVKFPYGIDKVVDLPYVEGEGLCASFAASATLFPVRIDIIAPIPLTPEILENNGLKHLYTYGTDKWICDNIRLNVYSSDNTWRFCADTKRNEDTVIYIHYVHELQHALRLCGIEKEITL